MLSVLLILFFFLFYKQMINAFDISLAMPPDSGKFFLPLFAIIVASTALWARLSVSIGQRGDDTQKITTSVGLLWDYMTILTAIMALGFFYLIESLPEMVTKMPVLRFFIFRITLGFAMTTFVMIVLRVIESILSLTIKGLRKKNLFESNINDIDKDCHIYLTMAVVLIAFVLLNLFICFSMFIPFIR